MSTTQKLIEALNDAKGLLAHAGCPTYFIDTAIAAAKQEQQAEPTQERVAPSTVAEVPGVQRALDALETLQLDKHIPPAVRADMFACVRPALASAPDAARPAPEVPGVPERWVRAVSLAYGHLWNVNNEPMAPVPQYSPEKAAYEARKALRDLLTHEQRGTAINEVRAMLASAPSPSKLQLELDKADRQRMIDEIDRLKAAQPAPEVPSTQPTPGSTLWGVFEGTVQAQGG